MQNPKNGQGWRHKLLQKNEVREVADSSFKIRKGELLSPQNLCSSQETCSHKNNSQVEKKSGLY